MHLESIVRCSASVDRWTAGLLHVSQGNIRQPVPTTTADGLHMALCVFVALHVRLVDYQPVDQRTSGAVHMMRTFEPSCGTAIRHLECSEIDRLSYLAGRT
jgi:hypothetical protein